MDEFKEKVSKLFGMSDDQSDTDDIEDLKERIDEFKEKVSELFGNADQQIHEIETEISEILDKVKEEVEDDNEDQKDTESKIDEFKDF